MEGAVVKGNVQIGGDSSVWFNAVIRADQSKIAIGDNTLIDIGAIILNGSKIGRDCIIGAGSLVLENTVVLDGLRQCCKAYTDIAP